MRTVSICAKCRIPPPPPVEEKPTTTKTYKVVVDQAFPPFEWQKENGEITGFSVDLMEAIAIDQGIKFEFAAAPFKGIFDRLDTGEVDAISASITITEERKKRMDFSTPYFEATQMILVKDGNADVFSFEDLKDKQISVNEDTTSDELVSKLKGSANDSTIKRTKSIESACNDVVNSVADATVGDNGVILYYVDNTYSVKLRTIVDPSFEKEEYGIAVRKNRDDELLTKIDTGLENIRKKGIYEQIRQKWFGKQNN